MSHETVWKYEIDRPGVVAQFMMPKNAEVLSAGIQDGGICIWARVDTGAGSEAREFVAVGTGRFDGVPLGPFVGRVTEGPFEWHVFEVAGPETEGE